MAEETPSPESAAPVEAPVATPAPETAPVAPESAPAPAETPSETPAEAPVPEDAPAEDKPAAEPEKPAEPEKSAEPPVEAKAEAEKPADPPPTNYEFKFPEGLQPADEPLNAFQGLLGKYGLTQEAGQALMDLHTDGLKAVAADIQQRQVDAFAETRAKWVSQFQKQAGNRRDTILNDAKAAITSTVTDAKERTELWNVLAFTGAGDHPAVINALAKMGKRLSERSAPAKGLPTNGAKSGAPWDKRYGSAPRR